MTVEDYTYEQLCEHIKAFTVAEWNRFTGQATLDKESGKASTLQLQVLLVQTKLAEYLRQEWVAQIAIKKCDPNDTLHPDYPN